MASHSKKLVNEVTACVEDCLQGVVALNSGLRILQGHHVIVRADIDEVKAKGKVTLVSGGGSGHEPAHAGYVGPGMLSAAVAGAVFTSPPPTSVLAAIRAVGKDNPAGTLLIIKNYTGDRLNFGLAAERAKAEGLKVEMVVVGEDCALTSEDKTAGRRGLCGTVFIHKIAGALAEEDKSLEEIVIVCRQAVAQMGTIGLSLSPCSVPGSGPSFNLGDKEMELGLGIHGEAGVKRMQVLPAQDTIRAMLDHMTNAQSSTHLSLKKGDQVALIVNNLGGTSVLELNIVAKATLCWLENQGVLVERAYCGSFMTSLEMAGVSVTLMHLDDTRRACLDQATLAPGWCRPLLAAGETTRRTPDVMACEGMDDTDAADMSGAKVDPATSKLLFSAVKRACDELIGLETQLNDLDRFSGDGDCGSTHARGAQALLQQLGSAEAPCPQLSCPQALLTSIAATVAKDMGGSSGALYSLFFTSAAAQLSEDTSPPAWASALQAGISAISRYGGAEPGDRTMLDALQPMCDVLTQKLGHSNPLPVLEEAVQAAEQGAASTAKMKAQAGRASYVAADQLKQPDPGAYAVGVWARAVCEALKAGSA